MATLHKKNTTILGRWRKDEETPDDDLVSERSREYVIRSDRAILKRSAAYFRGSAESKGYHHSWGWTTYGTIKKEIDAESFTRRFGENLVAKGYVRVIE